MDQTGWMLVSFGMLALSFVAGLVLGWLRYGWRQQDAREGD